MHQPFLPLSFPIAPSILEDYLRELQKTHKKSGRTQENTTFATAFLFPWTLQTVKVIAF